MGRILLCAIVVMTLAGCSLNLGMTPTEHRVRACPPGDGTFTAYGKQWACAVASVNTATEMNNWREVREAVCYEVKP